MPFKFDPFTGRFQNVPAGSGGGNATVPGGSAIQPPQAYVDWVEYAAYCNGKAEKLNDWAADDTNFYGPDLGITRWGGFSLALAGGSLAGNSIPTFDVDNALANLASAVSGGFATGHPFTVNLSGGTNGVPTPTISGDPSFPVKHVAFSGTGTIADQTFVEASPGSTIYYLVGEPGSLLNLSRYIGTGWVLTNGDSPEYPNVFHTTSDGPDPSALTWVVSDDEYGSTPPIVRAFNVYSGHVRNADIDTLVAIFGCTITVNEYVNRMGLVVNVSGSGSDVDGPYVLGAEVDGRPSYTGTFDKFIAWDAGNSRWYIYASGECYLSSNALTPWDAVWEVGPDGAAPVPTITLVPGSADTVGVTYAP